MIRAIGTLLSNQSSDAFLGCYQELKMNMKSSLAVKNCLFGLALLGAAGGSLVHAQDTCPNRGELDVMYCDANNDLGR